MVANGATAPEIKAEVDRIIAKISAEVFSRD